MTSSMTAFARVDAQHSWGSLVWEVRSVNHRYLEPHLRLPDNLRELELPVREALRKTLSRGKVECTLRLKLDETSAPEIAIDSQRLTQLIAACAQVEALCPRTAKVDPLAALQWPGVLQSTSVDFQQISADALAEFPQALEQLKAMRQREGAALKQFIEQRLEGIVSEVEEIRPRLPELLQLQREKILQRLHDACIEIDANRLEQELVILAQKADVDEELDRLSTHVTEVRRVLNSNGSIGRRLDFLMQELNREANTLGSKSIDAELTTRAVNLKVLIEQMREQVQNIE